MGKRKRKKKKKGRKREEIKIFVAALFEKLCASQAVTDVTGRRLFFGFGLKIEKE